MTEQRGCSFYIAWFYRCYVPSEHGWYCLRTPDGKSIMDQDAYFWRAVEALCNVHNLMLMEAQRNGSR
jgi:hypothetical protein